MKFFSSFQAKTIISLAAVVLSTFLVDQVTKFLFAVKDQIMNTGISFGLGNHLPAFWVTMGVAILFLILLWWGRKLWLKHPISGGLVIGGALSNILDRLVYGGVRDWLPLPLTHLSNNMADWAIGVGIVLILAVSVWERQSSPG